MRLEYTVTGQSRPYPLDPGAKPEALIPAAQDRVDGYAQKNLPNTGSVGHVCGSAYSLRQLGTHTEAECQNQIANKNRGCHRFEPSGMPLSKAALCRSNHQTS